MRNADPLIVCWSPTWNPSHEGVGLEHLRLAEGEADGLILAVDEEHGPFRLAYRLNWDDAWRVHRAELQLSTRVKTGTLVLQSDGRGQWHSGDGEVLDELDGCLDIDIWPTPFTNSFPLRRSRLQVGQRREFRMAWVNGVELTVKPQPQAYTRLADRLYLFESLDGSGFKAELPVDEHSLVLDYPGLFRRVRV